MKPTTNCCSYDDKDHHSFNFLKLKISKSYISLHGLGQNSAWISKSATHLHRRTSTFCIYQSQCKVLLFLFLFLSLISNERKILIYLQKFDHTCIYQHLNSVGVGNIKIAVAVAGKSMTQSREMANGFARFSTNEIIIIHYCTPRDYQSQQKHLFTDQ